MEAIIAGNNIAIASQTKYYTCVRSASKCSSQSIIIYVYKVNINITTILVLLLGVGNYIGIYGENKCMLSSLPKHVLKS